MEKFVIPIIGLIALLVILIFAIGAILDQTPQYAQVDSGSAFLFPADGRLVMALPQGGYYLNGTLQTGCWKLYPPRGGSLYGEAEYASAVCK